MDKVLSIGHNNIFHAVEIYGKKKLIRIISMKN